MRAALALAALVLVALCGLASGVAAGWFGVALLAMLMLTFAALAGFTTRYRSVARPMPARLPPQGSQSPAMRARERCTSAVSSALHGPREADTSLRPILSRIADTLLEARSGRGLQADPGGARLLLGEELYSFLDPGRRIRAHNEGSGLTADQVSSMLARLEELTWS